MFGRDPIFQSRLQHLEEEELGPTAAATQLQVFLERRGHAAREVIPLAMRNLAIARQRDKEWYQLGRVGGWDRPKASFKPSDSVLVAKDEAPPTRPCATPHSMSGGGEGL